MNKILVIALSLFLTPEVSQASVLRTFDYIGFEEEDEWIYEGLRRHYTHQYDFINEHRKSLRYQATNDEGDDTFHQDYVIDTVEGWYLKGYGHRIDEVNEYFNGTYTYSRPLQLLPMDFEVGMSYRDEIADDAWAQVDVMKQETIVLNSGVTVHNAVLLRIEYVAHYVTDWSPVLGDIEQYDDSWEYIWIAPNLGTVAWLDPFLMETFGDETIESSATKITTHYKSGNIKAQLLETPLIVDGHEAYIIEYYDQIIGNQQAVKKIHLMDGSSFSYPEPQPDLPGDLDGDRKVDLTDFGLLKANFGKSEATRADGDLDGNGKVDLTDFGILKANFGKAASISPIVTAIVERNKILETNTKERTTSTYEEITPSLAIFLISLQASANACNAKLDALALGKISSIFNSPKAKIQSCTDSGNNIFIYQINIGSTLINVTIANGVALIDKKLEKDVLEARNYLEDDFLVPLTNVAIDKFDVVGSINYVQAHIAVGNVYKYRVVLEQQYVPIQGLYAYRCQGLYLENSNIELTRYVLEKVKSVMNVAPASANGLRALRFRLNADGAISMSVGINLLAAQWNFVNMTLNPSTLEVKFNSKKDEAAIKVIRQHTATQLHLTYDQVQTSLATSAVEGENLIMTVKAGNYQIEYQYLFGGYYINDIGMGASANYISNQARNYTDKLFNYSTIKITQYGLDTNNRMWIEFTLNDKDKAIMTIQDSRTVLFTSYNGITVMQGDVNLDGAINLTDISLVKNNMGTGTTWLQGDVNSDGKVDMADFGIVRTNFGKTSTVDSAQLQAISEKNYVLSQTQICSSTLPPQEDKKYTLF